MKVPIFPLHTWLPDAHTEAPTAGSVILAAVLLKVGAYGLIRFNLTLFPEASRYFAPAVSVLAIIGIVYGAVVALRQTDIKRLVAYSSVSHLGFVVLGIFAFNLQATSGGVLQMVNHGLSTGGLFLVIGMLYERTHTRELGELGGLARVMPWLGGAFLVLCLSSLGLPGLNNFVGEFLVILGTLFSNWAFGAIAATGVILAAIYLLWSYQRAMVGPDPGEVREAARSLPARGRHRRADDRRHRAPGRAAEPRPRPREPLDAGGRAARRGPRGAGIGPPRRSPSRRADGSVPAVTP